MLREEHMCAYLLLNYIEKLTQSLLYASCCDPNKVKCICGVYMLKQRIRTVFEIWQLATEISNMSHPVGSINHILEKSSPIDIIQRRHQTDLGFFRRFLLFM